MVFIICVVLAYLLGSIPFGLVLTKATGAGDIRKIGSGNIGATNVLRTGRKGLAAATLILDAGKGAVAVVLARLAASYWHMAPADAETLPLLAAAASFLGHICPVWLGFNGGKGVATALGVLLALSWPVGLAALAIWLITAFALRYSSLAALIAAGTSPLVSLVVSGPRLALLALFLALLIVIRHRENIRRLVAGTESKIKLKRST
ncbi:MAG TPA: glycerol-3-phosphate 1-O-acyltransferase PlsY [Stellaceae bacterium]|jgi:glycerol-3-phosphate acyltransferase PlsY|nr:glycerol-3-phosphate 1-O-acyltransferase PlsY [Stellaceae bacterium]